MEFTYSQTIKVPIEKLFDLVDHEDNVRKWIPEIIDIHYPDGFDRANPVGTRFVQKIREGKSIGSYECEVINYEKPKLLVIIMRGRSFKMRVEYRFATQNDITLMKYRAEMESGSRMTRILGWLFRGMTMKILKRQMAALKGLAERGEQ